MRCWEGGAELVLFQRLALCSCDGGVLILGTFGVWLDWIGRVEGRVISGLCFGGLEEGRCGGIFGIG